MAAVAAGVLVLVAGCGGGGDGGSEQHAGRGKARPLGAPDFDGDGYQDAAVVVTGSAGARLDWVYGPVAVFRGGAEGPRPGAPLVAGSGRRDGNGFLEEGYSNPLTADLNRDGRTDLVLRQWVPVPNSRDNQERGGRTVVFHGGPDGLAAKPLTVRVPGDDPRHPFTATAVGDFDGDGNPDLYGGATLVFGPFSAAGKPREVRRVPGDDSVPGADATSVPFVADFDRDGRSDLLTGHDRQEEEEPEEGAPPDLTVRYFRGTPGKGLAEDRGLSERLHKAAGDQGTRLRAGADLDGDGYPDVVPPHQFGQDQRTYLRGGPGGLRPGTARLTLAEAGSVGTPLLAGHVTGRTARNTVSTAHYDEGRRGRLQLARLTARDGAVTMTGVQTVDLRTDGIRDREGGPLSPVSRDRFAETVRVLDADRDGHDDVLAVEPFSGPRGRYGGVWYLPGTAKGLDAGRAHRYGHDDLTP